MSLKKLKPKLIEKARKVNVPIKLSKCCLVSDPVKFVDNHISYLEESAKRSPERRHKETYMPYYRRLVEFLHATKNHD